jgi:hypothetical protein
MKKIMSCLFLLWMTLLASCGGGSTGLASGGGVGSGGTGITNGTSVGYISGFGSVYVNGVRHNTDNATLDILDASSLKLGMTVKITGTTDADFANGTASKVESAADIRGPVTAIDTTAGTLDVQGTTLTTDSETIFEGISGLAGLSAVTPDWVQIYGLPQGSGVVRATRIEKLTLASTPVISGYVTNLNTAASTLDVGILRISYLNASFIGGLTRSALANGQVLRVRALTNAAAGTLQADTIQVWNNAPLLSDAAVSLSGVVSDYAALGAFKVLNVPVDASAAQVTGGLASGIGNGVKVDVSGTVRGGVLVASQLRIRQIPGTGGNASFSLLGPVGNFVSPADFRVRGQPVDASGAGVVYTGGTAAALTNGAPVKITGTQVQNGKLIALTVTFNP